MRTSVVFSNATSNSSVLGSAPANGSTHAFKMGGIGKIYF